MSYTIGLATTFHDPAIAIIGPGGEVLFAEATERYLQYKRAPNCEPDSAPRMEGLLRRYIPKDAEIRIATSWGEEDVYKRQDIDRRADLGRDALEIDALGMERAVAIGEMMHGMSSQSG